MILSEEFLVDEDDSTDPESEHHAHMARRPPMGACGRAENISPLVLIAQVAIFSCGVGNLELTSFSSRTNLRVTGILKGQEDAKHRLVAPRAVEDTHAEPAG